MSDILEELYYSELNLSPLGDSPSQGTAKFMEENGEILRPLSESDRQQLEQAVLLQLRSHSIGRKSCFYDGVKLGARLILAIDDL